MNAIILAKREVNIIYKAKTLEPLRINKRDQL